MKLFSLLVFRKDKTGPKFLRSEQDLQEFSVCQRHFVLEFMKFTGLMILEDCKGPLRAVFHHEDYQIYCRTRGDGLGLILVSDLEYPQEPAFEMLEKIAEELPVQETESTEEEGNRLIQNHPIIRDMFWEYKQPTVLDKMSRITGEIAETKNILRQTLDQLFRRKGNLDTMVERSEELSKASKQFYKTTRKNKCCRWN